MIQINEEMTKLKLPIYAAFRSQNQLEMNEETQSKDSREREMETRQPPHHPSRFVREKHTKSAPIQKTSLPTLGWCRHTKCTVMTYIYQTKKYQRFSTTSNLSTAKKFQ